MTIKKLTYISILALILGHSMINTFFQSILLNGLGLLVTSVIIYYYTLRKNDFFSFIMIMYFTTLFPYGLAKGGAFNLVALTNILFYLFLKGKLPLEIRHKDFNVKLLITILFISSVIGWLTLYTGSISDLLFSSFTFIGILLLLTVSSSLILNVARIKFFINLNIVIASFSLLASLNHFLRIIPFQTPMFPVSSSIDFITNNIESVGIIGVSPFYGQHSMIVSLLMFSFLVGGVIHSKSHLLISRNKILFGLSISMINVFLSVSKAVFFSTLGGFIIVYILNARMTNINISKQFFQIITILIFGLSLMFVVETAGLDYVFKRIDEQNYRTQKDGGFTIQNILSGAALNRGAAFKEGTDRFKSRSWWFGYGYGLPQNNRDAFYVDSKIKRDSAHSQYFATLFIFGWLGFLAFWALHFQGIKRSLFVLKTSRYQHENRLFSMFSIAMIATLISHGVTADNISWPSYFGSTMILLGLVYSNSRKEVIGGFDSKKYY